jgi:monoamine oxidase
MTAIDLVDVVIVGAGFTGLAAATALRDAGYTSVVLEARDRVGGKVESSVDGLGRRFDSGGQFVADEMLAIRSLVEASGAHLVRNQAVGDALTVPAAWHDDWDEGEAAYESMRDLRDVPDDRWFHEWIGALRVTDGAKAALASAATGQMCMDHRLLGLAHAADQLRRTPPLTEELQYSVDRTMHSVAEFLAASLDVRVAQAVRSVHVGEAGVEVRTAQGSVHGRHVVVAVPPSVVQGIEFDPPLPDAVADAAAAFGTADVTKILLRYDERFWHTQGRNGTIRFCEPAGLYAADASVGDAHALVLFVGGPLAAAWRALGDDGRLSAALHHLSSVLGDVAAAPLDVQVRDWPPDEWGGGGYCQFVTGLGAPTQIEALLGGAPGITFAATEYADVFPGYVEGALLAGRRAAADAAQRMTDRPSGRVNDR